MKFQSPIIAQDAANQVAHDHLRRQGRSSPRIIDHSIVTAKFAVGPDESGNGGNSVFRVTHGLRRPPNVVYPMRWQARREDTVEYAGVLVATCDPISDDTYSYLSICTPVMMWAEDRTLDPGTGGVSVTFDEKWGTPRHASASYDTNATLLNSFLGYDISGQTVSWSGVLNELIHCAVFFGFPPNTIVTVDVYNAIMDGLALPSKTLGPSQAHSAGENVTAPLGQIIGEV